MSSQEVFVQQFTRLFEHYAEALSPHVDGESAGSRPAGDHNRLVAAARLAIVELETDDKAEQERRRYFATPGEAEWGC